MSDKHYEKSWHLLADRSRWTRFHCAEDRFGHVCNANDITAVRWCAYGALIKVYGSGLAKIIARKVGRNTGRFDITAWNDSGSYGQVFNKLRALDI